MKAVKNIIFDLGVVLLDLDFESAKKKFQELGLQNLDLFYSFMHANPFFHDYETGKIDDTAFLKGIQKMMPTRVYEDDIKEAWNSIVVGFPAEKIAFLNSIKKGYNIFLLSNTNHLHALKYEQLYLEAAGHTLHACFNKVYYSHEMGVRKPDHDAFRVILESHDLQPEETLFIDDQEANLIPAQEMNLQTLLYIQPDDLFGLLNE